MGEGTRDEGNEVGVPSNVDAVVERAPAGNPSSPSLVLRRLRGLKVVEGFAVLGSVMARARAALAVAGGVGHVQGDT